MGACAAGSTESNSLDRQIASELQQDRNILHTEKILLLAGRPHSGKTTLWKQLHYIHSEPSEHPQFQKIQFLQDIRQIVLRI